MFKVELEFDKTLPKDKLNILCEVTDEIFAKKNIPNIEQSLGKRNIFLTFVLATLKTAKCRDLSNRPAVPLVA